MHDLSEELLISRAIDRRAGATDWDRLAAMAGTDAGVWRRLALTLREDALLGAAASTALARFGSQVSARELPPPVRRRRTLRALARAAALVLAIGATWIVARRVPPAPANPPPSATANEPGQLLARYLRTGGDSGRVLQELPSVTLATRPSEDGRSLEVVYLRRLVERAVVDRAFRLAADEHGRPTTTPVDLANYTPPTDF